MPKKIILLFPVTSTKNLGLIGRDFLIYFFIHSIYVSLYFTGVSHNAGTYRPVDSLQNRKQLFGHCFRNLIIFNVIFLMILLFLHVMFILHMFFYKHTLKMVGRGGEIYPQIQQRISLEPLNRFKSC